VRPAAINAWEAICPPTIWWLGVSGWVPSKVSGPNPWAAYGESKLANLLFVRELVARGVTAYASDPGMTNTSITRDGSGALQWAGRVISPRIAQSPTDGARSTIQAITTALPNGTYFAPRGPFHQWGTPKPTKLKDKARDPNSARRLWELSAELTGCEWQGGDR